LTISGMGCSVLLPSAARGNWSYPDFWAVICGPWYHGYRTPIVAPEPFVERVVGAIHSTGGRIGTHMLLRVPLRDSVVRPCG
jgi:hypothetical protein